MERASKRCCCLLVCASGSSSSSPARLWQTPKVPELFGRNMAPSKNLTFQSTSIQTNFGHPNCIYSPRRVGTNTTTWFLPVKLWHPASVSEFQFLDEVFHLTFPVLPVSQQTTLPRITDASIPPCQVQFVIGSVGNAGNQFNRMRLMVSRM